MKTILYNPIFINPQAYYVFPRLTRWLRPDNGYKEPANYIGQIEVTIIAYGEIGYTEYFEHTNYIDFTNFSNSYVRISLFTRLGSCVLGEWKIGAMESDRPYIEPEVLASLKAVVIVGDKTNQDKDRDTVANLVDASNPFVISNAAFKLNSGFGKYEITFQYFPYTDNITTVSDSKVVFGIGGQLLIPYPAMTENIPSFKIKVSGLSGTYHFRYYYRSSDGVQHSIDMAQDGYYELPICYNVQSSSDGTNCGFANNGNDVVTITQIPSFEGAFVTDGVDDLITSTKTVQEMLGGSNELTIVSMVHQVKDSANNVSFTNYIRGSANGYFRNIVNNYDKTGIYGYTSSDLMGLSVVNNILGDKNDYTSNGDNRDSIINGNFSVQGYSYNDGNNTGDFSSVAWYWTIIANKVLTTDQINQVIDYFNLDRTLNPDILCNTIKQGITNENHAEFGDKLIDFSGNGRDIQLNNIAWKGGSGIAAKPYESIKDYTILSDEARQKLTIYNEFSYKVKSNTPYRDDFTRALVYQNKYKFGDVNLTIGEGVDGDTMWLGTFRDNDARFFNGAIYSLMSFPYSMSEFLIERQLKKHKLGTLYPNMVEFRPIIKHDDRITAIKYYHIKGSSWINLKPGDYIPVGSKISITTNLKSPYTIANVVSSSLTDIKVVPSAGGGNAYDILGYVTDKSPQKITMDIQTK